MLFSQFYDIFRALSNCVFSLNFPLDIFSKSRKSYHISVLFLFYWQNLLARRFFKKESSLAHVLEHSVIDLIECNLSIICKRNKWTMITWNYTLCVEWQDFRQCLWPNEHLIYFSEIRYTTRQIWQCCIVRREKLFMSFNIHPLARILYFVEVYYDFDFSSLYVD